LTGNVNALNSADTACAIVIQQGSFATVTCCRGTKNTGQTFNSCPTARTREYHDP